MCYVHSGQEGGWEHYVGLGLTMSRTLYQRQHEIASSQTGKVSAAFNKTTTQYSLVNDMHEVTNQMSNQLLDVQYIHAWYSQTQLWGMWHKFRNRYSFVRTGRALSTIWDFSDVTKLTWAVWNLFLWLSGCIDFCKRSSKGEVRLI